MRAERLSAIDRLRAISILFVVASHAVMAFAPRVAFGGCDRLRPSWLPCELAHDLSFLVPNILAVVVFAFLSERTVPTPPRSSRLAATLALLASPVLGDRAIVGAMLFGHLAARHPDWPSRRTAGAALILRACVAVLPDVRGVGSLGGALAFGELVSAPLQCLAAASLALGFLALARLQRPFMETIGRWSLPIFIVHLPILFAFAAAMIAVGVPDKRSALPRSHVSCCPTLWLRTPSSHVRASALQALPVTGHDPLRFTSIRQLLQVIGQDLPF